MGTGYSRAAMPRRPASSNTSVKVRARVTFPDFEELIASLNAQRVADYSATNSTRRFFARTLSLVPFSRGLSGP